MYFLYDLLSNYWNLLLPSFIYDILSYLVTENSEPKVDNIFYISSILILSIITLILNSIFLKIFKSVDLKNKIFEDNIQIISYLYLFFPLGLFIFPIVSSIFNIKLWKYWKNILIGSFIYCLYFWLYDFSYLRYNIIWISIIHFFPLFILFFLIWKSFWLIKNIFKNILIILLVLVFFTQPFYKNWFYEKNNSSTNQSICYDREQYSWPCFKIFKGFFKF